MTAKDKYSCYISRKSIFRYTNTDRVALRAYKLLKDPQEKVDFWKQTLECPPFETMKEYILNTKRGSFIDSKGWQWLHHSLAAGCTQTASFIVNELKDIGINNARNNLRYTVLHSALYNEHTNAALILLKHPKINVNKRTSGRFHRYTPFSFSILFKLLEVQDVIVANPNFNINALSRKTSPSQTDIEIHSHSIFEGNWQLRYGQFTALDLSIGHEGPATLQFLLTHPQIDLTIGRCYEMAIDNNDLDLLKQLCAKTPLPASKLNDCFDIALEKDYNEILMYLIMNYYDPAPSFLDHDRISKEKVEIELINRLLEWPKYEFGLEFLAYYFQRMTKEKYTSILQIAKSFTEGGLSYIPEHFFDIDQIEQHSSALIQDRKKLLYEIQYKLIQHHTTAVRALSELQLFRKDLPFLPNDVKRLILHSCSPSKETLVFLTKELIHGERWLEAGLVHFPIHESDVYLNDQLNQIIEESNEYFPGQLEYDDDVESIHISYFHIEHHWKRTKPGVDKWIPYNPELKGICYITDEA